MRRLKSIVVQLRPTYSTCQQIWTQQSSHSIESCLILTIIQLKQSDIVIRINILQYFSSISAKNLVLKRKKAAQQTLWVTLETISAVSCATKRVVTAPLR